MWPNLRVEELYPPSIQMDPELCPLRKEDFCPFMLWVTLPRDYVKAMMSCTLESTWKFGMLTQQVSYMGAFTAHLQHLHFAGARNFSHG